HSCPTRRSSDLGGREREHDLVGLDVDEILVTADRLADLLVPLQQRRLGDRFRQLRDLDFYQGHFLRYSGIPWIPAPAAAMIFDDARSDWLALRPITSSRATSRRRRRSR